MKRLKFFLEDKKFKQNNIVTGLKMTSGGISTIFSGKSKITYQFALSLQAKYNLNPEWLLEGKEPMYLPPNLDAFDKKTTYLIKTFQELPQKHQKAIIQTTKEEKEKHEEFLREQEEYERKHKEAVKLMMDNKIYPKYMVKIPIVGTVRAGVPTFSEENIEGYEYYADVDGMVKKYPERFFYLRVEGDSMNECRMWDGDIIMVEKNVQARNGDIVVVRIAGLEDEMTVKKIRFLPKTQEVELIPCNDDYKTLTYKGEDVVIEGVVINIDWRRKR